MNPETKNCQNCKQNFIIESDDFVFYVKMGVPAPTWCPFCRFVRKMTFINERSLYKRECANCKSSIISMYNPESLFPVMCVKCYLSDDWEAIDYGMDYNFSAPFFKQFKLLKDKVPSRTLDQNERNGGGTEYSNFCYTSKDAYLSFNVTSSENIKYSKYVLKKNKNSMDSLIFADSDRCYEVVSGRRNFNSSFLVESDQCVESSFLYDCSNCVNCCLSTNLRNKSYVFLNQQLSREDYLKAVKGLCLDTYSGQKKAKEVFEEIYKKAFHKFAKVRNGVNIVGDFIENSKNLYHCYGVTDAENLKNVFFSMNVAKDSQDLIFTGREEECYEVAYGGRGMNRVILSISSGSGSRNLFYTDNCKGCTDCFGCVNLKNKQHCILNKQYTKEEYEELLPKIKQHMNEMPYVDKVGRVYTYGEFFPTELSPFDYNETVAFEENPLTKEEIFAQGYTWREMETKSHTATIKSSELPDSIGDVTDEICKEVIECPNGGDPLTRCTSAFKIIPDELSFYKQMQLPLPRFCPNCRYHLRMKWRNQFRFYKRECMCDLLNHAHAGKCEVEFETSYAPDRPEIVYCEKCYQQEVI
jgi:hypothetical protein